MLITNISSIKYFLIIQSNLITLVTKMKQHNYSEEHNDS